MGVNRCINTETFLFNSVPQNNIFLKRRVLTPKGHKSITTHHSNKSEYNQLPHKSKEFKVERLLLSFQKMGVRFHETLMHGWSSPCPEKQTINHLVLRVQTNPKHSFKKNIEPTWNNQNNRNTWTIKQNDKTNKHIWFHCQRHCFSSIISSSTSEKASPKGIRPRSPQKRGFKQKLMCMRRRKVRRKKHEEEEGKKTRATINQQTNKKQTNNKQRANNQQPTNNQQMTKIHQIHNKQSKSTNK